MPGLAIRFAKTGAFNCVLLTKLVARLEPFHCTSAPGVNPAPFTVKVKPDDPAVALVGEMEVRLGVTVNVAEFEVTPPVVRVTGNVPAVVIRLAVTVAVTWLALTTVVARGVPLKFTTESPPKLLPLTVRVNAAPPAEALVGLMELIAGADPTVKLTELEARPPEVTDTGNVPAAAIRFAGIDAVNWEIGRAHV